MDDYTLLIDLHKQGHRQGPGGDAETELALDLAKIDRTAPLKVADIGCGTGASTLVLARLLNARITAVDFLQDFLDVLEGNAERIGVADRISTLACAMDNLAFADQELDVIWSEGAIYNIGFERGVREWRKFLKPGGFLAVTEASWFTEERPEEIDEFWKDAYPEIDTIPNKVAQMQNAGYVPVATFVLPENCWTQHFYIPQKAAQKTFLEKHPGNKSVEAFIENERREAQLYAKYKEYYGYVFYIGKKV